MMKNFQPIFWLMLLALTNTLFAQTDTLLFNDFQNFESEPVIDIVDPDSLENGYYINWDQDELADANGRPQSWAVYTDLKYMEGDSIPPLDTNFVLGSSSWLNGFLDGNRNWFMLPSIQIVDDQATLHWKSAPFQGPRYMDGYTVVVQVDEFNPFTDTDTLFRQSQMIPPLPTSDSAWVSVDSFQFFPNDGYIHADRYTLTDYFTVDTAGALYGGLLEPHSISLAQYSGKTIYISFLHDSDDDNLITIDDLLVLGTTPPVSSIINRDPLDLRLVTYPNPTENMVNLLYRLKESSNVSIQIQDLTGRIIQQTPAALQNPGEYSEQFDVRQLPAGQYNIAIWIDGQVVSKSFIKR